MNKIKVISFDLDNTLYDNWPVIQRAEKESQNYLTEEFQKQKKEFTLSHFLSIRKELVMSNNIAFDNLTHLREECLRVLCCDLKDSDLIVKTASKIFIQHRQLAPITNEIVFLLNELSQKYILVSITNGNCDANNLKIGKFFSKNYSPQQGYRAKPHTEMFDKVFQDFQIQPEELLHIGDEEKSDGLGALNAGCQFYLFAPFKTNLHSSINLLRDFIERE